MEFFTHSFTQRLPLNLLIWVLHYLRLMEHLEIFRVSDHLTLLNDSLLRAFLLLHWHVVYPQVFDNDRAVVDAAYDALDVVTALELALREWTLQKPALFVAQLPKLIVAPDEESAVVECRDTVPSAASQVVDVQGFVLIHINKA